MTLGLRIRNWRKHHKWTLSHLSLMTGLTISYLSDIEREKTIPSIPTLVKLADAFDTTVAFLITGIDFGEKCRHV